MEKGRKARVDQDELLLRPRMHTLQPEGSLPLVVDRRGRGVAQRPLDEAFQRDELGNTSGSGRSCFRLTMVYSPSD